MVSKNFIHRVIIILLSILLFSCKSNDTVIKRPIEGELDLTGYKWNRVVQLDGEWAFQWNIFATKLSKSDRYITVPSNWGQHNLPDIGYGTYSLEITGLPKNRPMGLSIKDISNAYRVYAIEFSRNGVEQRPVKLIEVGRVARSESAYIPHLMPSFTSFQTSSGNIRLIIQVANYTIDKGGIWSSVRLGLFQRTFLLELFIRASQFLLMGILLYIVIQNTFYYIQRHKERLSLYFALFSALLIVREISSGRLAWIFHGVTNPSKLYFEVWTRIDLAIVYFMPGVFILFLRNIFPNEVDRRFVTFTTLFTLITGTITLSLPPLQFLFFLKYMHIFIIFIALYSLYIYFKAIKQNRQGAKAGFTGLLFFVVAVINDILNYHEIIQTGYYLGFGFLLFIFAQTLLISIKYNASLRSFEKINSSLQRFIPHKMLKVLGMDPIENLSLGDTKECNMTVLSLNIEEFSSIREVMNPDELFKFLNSYITRISPAINSYGGFIHKYLGDGVLALFPGRPINGVLAALDILDSISIYNYHRSKSGYTPIDIGIGMDVGPMIMGTIGENERIDTNIVAEAVNISSRLEELTKEFSAEIIISDEILKAVKDDKRVGCRELGRSIYHVMRSSDSRLEYYSEFTLGVTKLHEGDKRGASEIFSKLISEHPEDITLKTLLHLTV